MRTPRKIYKELKDFKLRVGLGAYNAIQLKENGDQSHYDHQVKIGNAVFTFYPFDRETVDKVLSKFKTTVW